MFLPLLMAPARTGYNDEKAACGGRKEVDMENAGLETANVVAVAMWGFSIFFGVGGLMILVVPNLVRNLVLKFHTNARIRVLAVLAIGIGIALFRYANHTTMPLGVKVIGVASFMEGGTALIIPAELIVLNEWWVNRANIWMRISSFIWFVFACFFHIAH